MCVGVRDRFLFFQSSIYSGRLRLSDTFGCEAGGRAELIMVDGDRCLSLWEEPLSRFAVGRECSLFRLDGLLKQFPHSR